MASVPDNWVVVDHALSLLPEQPFNERPFSTSSFSSPITLGTCHDLYLFLFIEKPFMKPVRLLEAIMLP